MTKTLFLFTDYQEDVFHKMRSFFFEKEGDYSHLDNTFINSLDNREKERELWDIMKESIERLCVMPTKDWDFFVKTGIY